MAKILVLDDDPLICQFIKRALRSRHEVETADNGLAGLQIIKESTFDLLITDILMPTKDGLETIMELRQTMPDFKIVAISGGGHLGNSDYYLRTAKLFGAFNVLNKPFSVDELRLTVSKALIGEDGEDG